MGTNPSSKVCDTLRHGVFNTFIYFSFLVPNIPTARGVNVRQRGDETPSHPGGLSEAGRTKLEEYRRNREKQKGQSVPRSFSSYFPHGYNFNYNYIEGISAVYEVKEDAPRGLSDFQRRLNRDRDRGWNGKRDYKNNREGGNGWDVPPRTDRSGQDNAISVRVPNVGWESTPRGGPSEDSSGWGGTQNRSWDAPTPRAVREASPDDGDRVFGIDAREWEEEQVRLDRDWYNSGEDTVAGDNEHNPLSQYEDLTTSNKQAEMANKPVVSLLSHARSRVSHFYLQKKISARQAQYVCHLVFSLTRLERITNIPLYRMPIMSYGKRIGC
jgi:pre-mRNA-splicing factor ATP-dependent RNA helicase DHX38/PRP16